MQLQGRMLPFPTTDMIITINQYKNGLSLYHELADIVAGPSFQPEGRLEVGLLVLIPSLASDLHAT